MTTPTPADRLALAVCRAGNIFPSTPTCATPCGQCRRISQAHACAVAAILRERHAAMVASCEASPTPAHRALVAELALLVRRVESLPCDPPPLPDDGL